jgi:hypothetical protein
MNILFLSLIALAAIIVVIVILFFVAISGVNSLLRGLGPFREKEMMSTEQEWENIEDLKRTQRMA